jgi:beta-lactamase class C
MRIEMVLSILVAAAATTPAPVMAGAWQGLADEFESRFQAQVTDRDYPGAAFAIVTRDEVIRMVATGHTDASRSTVIDSDTVFRLASVSKTFSAGLVAMLEADGLLAWDDPVVRHVPEFRIDGDSSRIQIRHLLEHSSGLMPHAYDNLVEDGVSNDRIMNKLGDLSYICTPGNCYGYQNFVFALVQPATERVTSQSFSSLVEQRIFNPLDMRTASIGFDRLVSNPNHALPHVRSRGAWKTVPVLPNYYRIAPAAGVNASIRDVALWLQAQLGSHPDVISPELVGTLAYPRLHTRRELYRNHWKDQLTDAHYGMGWRVYRLGEEEIIYHGGWVRGYRADVAFSLTRGVGLAILLNVEGNSISALSAGFWELATDTSCPLEC